MNEALLQTLPGFAWDFGHALGVNLSLAGNAFAIGLPVGLVLGALRLPPAPPGIGGQFVCGLRSTCARGAGLAVALMRAAPTFVVMYVLLEALPARWALSAPHAVALALAVYASAYVADSVLAALTDRQSTARSSALPFLMGLARVYFVMVLSSGFGAAIGVTEATAVTLRALEQLPTLGDRLALMAGVVSVFVVIRQMVFGAIARLPGLLTLLASAWLCLHRQGSNIKQVFRHRLQKSRDKKSG